ncbi:MAG: 2-succinyl-5-enolpyruvyl-6-hydroxy-3-cyclohexene-1-carboxylic-acid synthase [Bdellovibrionota bacterium]
MTNMQLAEEVVRELVSVGVKEFCLCAGARNSPLIHFFDKNPHLKAYHFFEERSASFFALGKIAQSRRPVAIITTSGTAAAELLPATVEATYSSLPLILITADRPKSYRGSGAPQTIEQVGLFSYYIEACFDLDEENTHISLKGLSWRKPVHINMCFKEPLLDGEPTIVQIPEKEQRIKFPESFPLSMVDDIQNFLEKNRPVVLVSTLPEKTKKSVLEFLKNLKAPIYAEAISGFRGHPELQEDLILSGEKMVARLLDQGHCDAVMRLGGTPTLRLWRDLETHRVETPVLSIGYNHFTGLSREILHFSDLIDLSRIQVKTQKPLTKEVKTKDLELSTKMNELFIRYPRSEPALINALSKKIGSDLVYLGNSLPVREWDLAADPKCRPVNLAANRGANGIDGQVSTFLGWALDGKESWCVIGDLTALYDLSSLWIANQLAPSKLRIVVINNKGGMIFKRIFNKEIYLNRHQIQFQNWAKMWGWDYQSWEEVPGEIKLSDRQVIEILPSDEQTEMFWNEWEVCWKN